MRFLMSYYPIIYKYKITKDKDKHDHVWQLTCVQLACESLKTLKKLSLYLTRRALSGQVDDEFMRTSRGLSEMLTQFCF